MLYIVLDEFESTDNTKVMLNLRADNYSNYQKWHRITFLNGVKKFYIRVILLWIYARFLLLFIRSIRQSICVFSLQATHNWLLQKQCLCSSGFKKSHPLLLRKIEKNKCWAKKISHLHHSSLISASIKK